MFYSLLLTAGGCGAGGHSGEDIHSQKSGIHVCVYDEGEREGGGGREGGRDLVM